LVLGAGRHDRWCGQRAQDGLHNARREPPRGVTDERTVFAVKNGGKRRIDRQVVEDRSERPLKLRFAGRFAEGSG
jgi:hypothetical protein